MPRVAAKDRHALIESRRAQILDAAMVLWAERGFDATSVDAIARDAGVSKGTVYLYFDSKDALLDELVVRHSLLPDVERIMATVRDQPLERVVELLVRAVWQRLREERDLIRILVRELPTRLERSRTLIERVVLPANQLFARFLHERLGAQRASELNLLVAGRGLFGSLLAWFITQELLGGNELLAVPEREITDTLTELFLHGVRGAEPAA